MDEHFLNFLILEEGIVFCIAETILYVENRLIDKYFEDKFEVLEKVEKQQLRWATASAMVLIFFIYDKATKPILRELVAQDGVKLLGGFSVGILIHLCMQTLTKSALPSHSLLVPSIMKVVKKYASYFCVWDLSLNLNMEDVIVRKENIVKYLNEITLMWTFLSCIKKSC